MNKLEFLILSGTSQFGFVDAPVVELDGSLAGAGVDGLAISAGDLVRTTALATRRAIDSAAVART